MTSSHPFLQLAAKASLIGIQLICLSLLWVSCFPGAFDEAIVWVILLAGGSLAVMALGGMGFGLLSWIAPRSLSSHRLHTPQPDQRSPAPLRSNRPHRSCPSLKGLATLTGLIILMTVALLIGNVPQQLAFVFARPAFEALIADSSHLDRTLATQVGIYRVVECRSGTLNAVYCQTGQHGFVWTQTCGFAYLPQLSASLSSPYLGTIQPYRLISGNWYEFTATGFD